MNLRKPIGVGVAGLVAVAGASVAMAATAGPNVTVKAQISPNKAGTRRHPQGEQLKVRISWQNLGSANQPVVKTFDVLFPKGSKYQGGKYPSCSYGTLNSVGPSGCPKASIEGSGSGTAFADTTLTHPQITVVNGGATKVFFYTVLNNPARVQSPVVGTVSKMSGKYSYKLHVVVPSILQVVAGVPIALTDLSVTAGHKSWLATTGCSHGHWPFSVTTAYDDFPDGSPAAPTSFTDSIRCHSN